MSPPFVLQTRSNILLTGIHNLFYLLSSLDLTGSKKCRHFSITGSYSWLTGKGHNTMRLVQVHACPALKLTGSDSCRLYALMRVDYIRKKFFLDTG